MRANASHAVARHPRVIRFPWRRRRRTRPVHVSAMKQNATSGGNSRVLKTGGGSHLECAMKGSRLLAGLVVLTAIAAVPASTGADNRSTCGIALTSDATFQRLDRVQSVSAAKICAIYLNTIDARLSR